MFLSYARSVMCNYGATTKNYGVRRELRNFGQTTEHYVDGTLHYDHYSNYRYYRQLRRGSQSLTIARNHSTIPFHSSSADIDTELHDVPFVPFSARVSYGISMVPKWRFWEELLPLSRGEVSSCLSSAANHKNILSVLFSRKQLKTNVGWVHRFPTQFYEAWAKSDET
ncbi:hypothetical protein C8R45DRAFT_928924 [Mycena sanguinolenta]|nr:hypothetical protein C8R45DRAFT_928924 [Mycena sanguinolenta]